MLNSGNILELNVRMINIWHLYNTTNSWFVLLNKIICYGLGHNGRETLKMWVFIFLRIIPVVFMLSVYPSVKLFFLLYQVASAFNFYSWL